MDVVRVPVVFAARAEKSVLDADLLELLSSSTQFLVDIAGGHKGAIGVVNFFPIQRHRAELLIVFRHG